MADGETEFLNDALSQVGATIIGSMDDGTINANYCKTFWPALRRGLLRQHHWNFAQRRVELAQALATPPFEPQPVYEFTYRYALPDKYIKLVEYQGIDVNIVPADMMPTWKSWYRIEGLFLLTNDTPVFITYVYDEDNMTLWDPMLYQGAAAWLASKLATAIPKDEKLSANKLMEADRMVSMATSMDGQEGTVLPFISDSLIWGR
jgi:hypothetical protein